MDKNHMKEMFEESRKKIVIKNNSSQISEEKYKKLVGEVNAAKSGKQKVNRNHWLLRHYDVISENGQEKLIFPKFNDSILYYVSTEEMFDLLYETHIEIGHGGRDKMNKELQKKYKNVTIREIQIFLEICPVCLQKKKLEKKEIVVIPTDFKNLNSKCQVDSINFQSQSDGDYKFILVYQDDRTKFVVLRALKSQKSKEVAAQILDILLLFGAPSTLQLNNGLEFRNPLMEKLKTMWPSLNLVLEKPRPNQSQGRVERANQDIEYMLTTWMMDNKCSNWSMGIGYVQFMKNRAYHPELQCSPYESMFGKNAKMGLPSSQLHVKMLKNINSEEDLGDIIINENKIKIEENQEENEVPIENILQDIKMDMCLTCLEVGGTCSLCLNKNKILVEREGDFDNLQMQAKRMRHVSDASHLAVSTSPENVISWKNLPTVLTSSLINAQPMKLTKAIITCTCSNTCINNRCSCKKNNVLCNSKCHFGGSCYNYNK